MRLKFSWVFYICMRKKHYFDNKRNQWVGLNFCNELLLYWTISSNINGVRMQKFHSSLIFFSLRFFLQFHMPAWEGNGQSLYLPTISAQSQTFRNLFVVLHLRLLRSIINHSACNYQAFAQLD